jgi:hypothetical protein
MFASLARMALGFSALAAVVLGVTVMTPQTAQAVTCGGVTLPANFPNLPNGNALAGCSTVLVINPGGSVTVLHNNNPFTNSGDVLVGVVNNSGGSVFDLFLTGFAASNGIFNIQSSEALCATSLAPSLACTGATGDEGGIVVNGHIVGQNIFNGIGIGNGVALNFGDLIFSSLLGSCTATPASCTAIFALGADVLAASVSPIPVPEPGSFAVFGSGLVGLILYRRRRQRAAMRMKLQTQLQLQTQHS